MVVIPLSFLILALILISLFITSTNSKQNNHTVVESLLKPTETIEVSEHFSGELYFNNEFGQINFSTLITGAINKAQSTIEVAVYSMDHPVIRDALYRAANRGVKVTLLLSANRKVGHDRIFVDLPKNMERIDIGGNGLMHDKFLLIDRGLSEEKLLFGSYNFTLLQEQFDPSFIMETTRREIVKVFGEEFDRIKAKTGENTATNIPVNRNPFAAKIQYPEGSLEIWFSPGQMGSNTVRERLVGLIKASEKSLEAMIWYLTDKTVAKAILAKAKEGETIKILTDDYNFSGSDSVFPYVMKERETNNLKTLEILTDHKRNQEIEEKYGKKDFNSFLHHHMLLVDNKIALFGTNNWSTSGFFNNDESIMVTTIPSVVTAFKEAFDTNYTKAK